MPAEPALAQARQLHVAVEKRCGESQATDDADVLLLVATENANYFPSRSGRNVRSAIAVLRCAVIDWWYLPTTECDQGGADVCDAAERNNIPALIAALEAKDAT